MKDLWPGPLGPLVNKSISVRSNLFTFEIFNIIIFMFYRHLALSTNCIEKIANLNGLSMYCPSPSFL